MTYGRRPLFHDAANRELLRRAIESCREERPFTIEAFVLLPDHMHAVWKLPDGDADFSTRWGIVKKGFTQAFLAVGGEDRAVSVSRQTNRRRGVWQRRFWEHLIRDTDDYNNHLDYIHYNPVKHGLANCPHAWPMSSFHRHVTLRNYGRDWLCHCNGQSVLVPSFDMLPVDDME